MRRTFMLVAMLLALGMITVACAQPRDTGFPPIEKDEGEDGHNGNGSGGFETPEPQTEPAAELKIQAFRLEFNRDLMIFAADTPITLTFENLEQVPHNVAIYSDEDVQEEIFVGETFTGVATRGYQVPPTPAGEYYFQCDVHPNMKGEARFE